jgi:CheY-like chemotaxis protein
MRILIVEDDYLQADWFAQKIGERFGSVSLDFVRTELEFRERLEDFLTQPPDLVLLDVMLRWTDPSPTMVPAPPEVEAGGFFRAGLRCERLLRQSQRTQNVPVILYTVLEDGDLEAELEHVGKRTRYIPKDSDAQPLIEAIETALTRVATGD